MGGTDRIFAGDGLLTSHMICATTETSNKRDFCVMHVTASPCFGGTERQMLGLGRELRGRCRSVFVSFQEEGRCGDFVNAAAMQGWEAYALKHDTPRVFAALSELTALARRVCASLVCSHGYKANLLGLLVARRLGIPIISVSHGWTAESRRVRLFEAVDRRVLRLMNKVVCVSEGQAKKVRAAGVRSDKVRVICDAVHADRFANPEPEYRQRLEAMFPHKPSVIVGAAGRLSPEKGFGVLVDAAAQVLASPLARSGNGNGLAGRPEHDGANIGFVLFGDGPLRATIESRIAAHGLQGRFHLAGFSLELDKYYPHFDVLALPSYTEGLPNVVLEAFAAGVPVVATAVGGTPEVVRDGVNGYLVKPDDAAGLARRIADVVSNPSERRAMAARGQEMVRDEFSFARQGREYQQLFESLTRQ